MSLPRPISPLLDGYHMGEAITAHHGVYSCPALRGESEEQYIVKIISIPPSQDQLDALLLTGAFENELRAQEYFQELAEGVCDEVRILERLSKVDSFVPFTGCQIERKEDGIGFDVYMLHPYRPSLEDSLHSQPLTHLAAVNLGLDMCAALSVSRKAGYLYANLKPNNIFNTETHGYCIGDLGFIPLSSLQYASLPEKYRSGYTAPEVKDAYASLSDSLDIYALGLVLYQVYNNGELPAMDDEVFPSPMYADYEMAEIILKACAPHPADRWESPEQMGQALVDYMQRNSINDTSIVPPPPEPLPSAEPEDEEFLTEEENDAELAELLAMIPEEEPPQQEAPEEISPGETEEGEASEETVADSRTGITEDGVTGEVADILAQADDLLQTETPEPVVVPEPVDIPIPPPLAPNVDEAEEASPSEEDEPSGGEEQTSEEEVEEEAVPEEDSEEDVLPDIPYLDEIEKSRKRRWTGIFIAAVILVLLALGAHFFYQNWYLQPIDSMTVDGGKDSISITVVTAIDESKLTVICTDTYGNTLRQPIQDGQTHFTDLKPNTQYKIQLQMEGFHKLSGNTTASFTTATQTKIVSFNASMGNENGSVLLSFVSDGPDSDRWYVEYTATGSSPQTKPFVDKSVTLTGLLTSYEYTFRILSEDDLFITGESEMVYQVKPLILPLGVALTSYADGNMTVSWTDTLSISNTFWTVRCRSDAGYDEAVTVTGYSATFTGLDMTVGYTVTVTYEGMPRGESIHVNPNPINVTEYIATAQTPWSTLLFWEYTGQSPSGWILSWEVDGVKQEDLLCQTNQATITVRPGASYRFEARPADEVTCFTGAYSYTVTDVPTFEGYGITAADITVTTHRTPSNSNWRARDLGEETQSSEFALEDSACLLLNSSDSYAVTDDMVTTTFVIFDGEGKHISTTDDTRTWDDMWSKRQCAVELPQMPTQPGDYSLDLYIADQYVTTVEFTVK